MEDETMIKKLKLRFEFYKYLLGTVMIAILTLGFNWTIELLKHNAVIRERNAESFTRFMDNLQDEDDPVKQLSLVKALAMIENNLASESKDSTSGFNGLFNYLKELHDKRVELENDKLKDEYRFQAHQEAAERYAPKEVKRMKSVTETIDDPKSSAEAVEKAQKELIELKENNQYISNLSTINQEVIETDKVINKVNKQSQLTSTPEKSQQRYNVKDTWFKEGYSVTFGEITILCKKLIPSDKSATILIEDNSGFKEEFLISEGREKHLASEKYIFKFDRMGRAGKNPFNYAVYFKIKIKEE
jgi:hypothetical protein